MGNKVFSSDLLPYHSSKYMGTPLPFRMDLTPFCLNRADDLCYDPSIPFHRLKPFEVNRDGIKVNKIKTAVQISSAVKQSFFGDVFVATRNKWSLSF